MSLCKTSKKIHKLSRTCGNLVYFIISHHIVRNSGRRTEHRGAPSPAMHSTGQARHPALNLHSRVPEQAAGGKGKAYASVETVPEEPMMI